MARHTVVKEIHLSSVVSVCEMVQHAILVLFKARLLVSLVVIIAVAPKHFLCQKDLLSL